MTTLTHANRELFRRRDDERYADLQSLAAYCRTQKQQSIDRWQPPQQLRAVARDGELMLAVGDDGEYQMNEWSFGQLCSLSRVSRDTVNRLLPETAAKVFADTMPSGQKPLQLLTSDRSLRSIHGVSYTRLWNLDVVNLIRECATDFQPPQTAMNGGTGLYAGEEDMFCFLIDPTGWTEIEGEAFAPGFFVWNSEVGKRSVGISTFWFQAVCQNHIVWDAIEVVELTRKHTAGVGSVLTDIRRTIDSLVRRRDERRDGFVKVMVKAMKEKLGDDAESVLKELAKNGIPRQFAKDALEIAQQQGRFTIFSLVDAMTRLAGRLVNAGDRLEMDAKAAQLLALAA
jgi:hypothetical protein